MSRKTLAALAVLSVVATLPAHAIPIAFDFSGVVQRRTVQDHGSFVEDLSGQGQNFTARLVIDTDLMTLHQVDDFGSTRQSWHSTNFLPTASEPSITIGGAPLPIALYGLNTYAATLQDSSIPPGCSVCGASDSVMLMWRSQEQAPAVGTYRASTFSMIAYESIFSGGSPNYLDLGNPFDIDDLLTMPLPNVSLQFGTTVFECFALNFCGAGYVDTTWFTTTSVTRTDLSQVSVPEPGTLGLLAMGLVGAVFARRRRDCQAPSRQGRSRS